MRGYLQQVTLTSDLGEATRDTCFVLGAGQMGLWLSASTWCLADPLPGRRSPWLAPSGAHGRGSR